MSASVPAREPGSPPSILIVGAGCVGRVFAYHLARAGARVTFLVRPQYRAQLSAGYALHQLRLLRAPRSIHVEALALLDQLEQVEAQRFDLVLLTMSSAALRGDWLAALLTRIGSATLVSLQPDARDHALIAAAWPAAQGAPRLVCGNIGFIAFDAPLPGQRWERAPGVATWSPPLSRSAFSGPRAAVVQLVDLLRRGGLPAAGWDDVARSMALPSALGMTWLAALEACDWSIERLRGDPLARTAGQAIGEVIAILQRRLGGAVPGVGLLRHVWLVALGFRLASWVVPFPLLAFVRKHFTKVAAQTHLILAGVAEDGARTGLDTRALRALLAQVQPCAASSGRRAGSARSAP